MKRALIVHCWGGKPNHCWYPQTKLELEVAGFEVQIPAMPNTDKPNLSEWLHALKNIIGAPDEDLYLIGHSLGCATILRYLENIDVKISGVVLVAGFAYDLGIDEVKSFIMEPFEFERIKNKSKNFLAILSDNDPFIDEKHGQIFQKSLGATLSIYPGKGHFTGPIGEPGSCISLPEVSEAILTWSSRKR